MKNIICLRWLIPLAFWLIAGGTNLRGAPLPQALVERAAVLHLLDHSKSMTNLSDLAAMGPKVLPILWEECQQTKVDSRRLSRIFGVVARVDADRAKFTDFAAARLAAEDLTWLEMGSALNLLRAAKATPHAEAVASVLKGGTDEFMIVKIAETLAVIGSEDELAKLESWLKTSRYGDDEPPTPSVRKSTERLRERLAKEKENKSKP